MIPINSLYSLKTASNSPKTTSTVFSYRGKKNKKNSDSGRKIPFPVPAKEISSAGTGNGIFLPLSENFFFGLFWPFLLKMAARG